MSKYSNEFKLEVIKYYNEGHGFISTAKHFNIPAMSTVQKWVRKYNANGIQGLIKNPKTSYSGEFKQKGYNWINKDGNLYLRQYYTRNANKEKAIWYDDKDENGYLVNKYFKIEYGIDKNYEMIQITEEKEEEVKREVIETSKEIVDEVIENNTPIISLQWIFNMIYAKDFR